MNLIEFIVILLPVVGTRKEDYCKMDCGPIKHVMCKYQCFVGNACEKGLIYFLKTNDKKEIVDTHNLVRSRIATGQHKLQPVSSNMKRLFWNKSLARIAQRLVIQCIPEDVSICCRTSRFSVVSSTYSNARVSLPLHRMVEEWYDSVVWFPYPSGIRKYIPSRRYDKYVNMVWANTSAVGCGRLKTGKGGIMYQRVLCLYAPGTQPGLQVYKIGGAGTECESNERALTKEYSGLCHPKDKRDVEPREAYQDANPCGASVLSVHLFALMWSLLNGFY